MKKIALLTLTLFLAIAGYAQKNVLAGSTWDEGFETWTFNSNGTITKKSNRSKSYRLGGVLVQLGIHKTYIGTKWTLDGDYLYCEDIPLQVSYSVDYPRYAYSPYQQQLIDAALPSFKQQVIKSSEQLEKESWQSYIGRKYFYIISYISVEKMCIVPNGNARAEKCLYRDVSKMTAAQKAAIEKGIAEKAKNDAAEKAKREAAEKAEREAAEKAKREAAEKAEKMRLAEEQAMEKAKADGYADLGLPSGTLWAIKNIGATNPEDFGSYFKWGETIEFNPNQKYIFFNDKDDLIKYGTDSKTELDLEDDIASVNLGSDWRIPTEEQFKELVDIRYTTTRMITYKGVSGLKITSKVKGYEGNNIFLPAAGNRSKSSLNGAGTYGNYWSRTLNESRPNYARYLYFDSGSNYYMSSNDRYNGRSVRPVRLSK